jgi:hypothetical protein
MPAVLATRWRTSKHHRLASRQGLCDSVSVTRRGLWLLALLIGAACARESPRPQVPLPAPTRALEEEQLAPAERPHLEIVDLEEEPSADERQVTLRGVLRNDGTGPTRQIVVHVDALDGAGVVLSSVDAVPSTQELPAGDTATFTATMEAKPEVARYHVRAVSR